MKPVVLCILDGVGIREEIHGNAWKQAKTPYFDMLYQKYPHTTLKASGQSVGLPISQMGNSEVGHLNLGAGRIVYQPLQFINKQIEDGSFYNNKVLKKIISDVKGANTRLQIFGLLSDGGIHSHINHLLAILEMCQKEDIHEVYLHLFTDGRDTLTNSASIYFEQLQKKIDEIGFGKIATISGRFYAMDRDNRWDRIEKVYHAVVNGVGEEFISYQEVLSSNYEKGITDEFIVPAVLDKNGCIKSNDCLLVFNYRPDRLRELFSALTNPKFKGFKRSLIKNLKLVTMMPVSDEVIYEHAFKQEMLENTLGEYISTLKKKQLRIAETEKYAHVTYFFDGGLEKDLPGCDRILIPSPKVTTYDLSPNMSSIQITDTLLAKLDEDYDLVILNYANGDMLGHTGNLKATIQSIETLDTCLGRLYNKIKEKDGILVVTADHGNCEIMLDDEDRMITSHTTSNVPFIITKSDLSLNEGSLCDVAPTILSLMGLEQPKEMTGKNLIRQKRKKWSKDKWFVAISILFLFSLFSIYTIRFFHYYRLEHPTVSHTVSSLGDQILLKEKPVLSGDGLYLESNGYRYKGNVTNNYVYYSNRYFRIVKINDDKSITLVTDENETSMVWNYQDQNYKVSSIRRFLNPNELENTGIFYNSLVSPDRYLKTTEFCIDETDGSQFSCKKTVTDKVGLLTVEDYKEAFANRSYLNNGTYFWTMSTTKDGIWYVFDEGGINAESHVGDTYYSYGVRPVITLKSDVPYVSGDGTKENPYQIYDPNNQTGVGSFVSYSDSLWRIVSISDGIYRMMRETPIVVDQEQFRHIYSTTSSDYNKNDYTSLAYYLNHMYIKTLRNHDNLLEVNWHNGMYASENQYHYTSIYETSVSAKIGLPSLGMLFLNGKECVTMTKANDNMVYVLNENGSVYAEDVLNKVLIRPMIAISLDVTFAGGSGTKENPLILE